MQFTKTGPWVVALLAAIAFGAGTTASPAHADAHEFDISVYHGINGKSLGLSKELPVTAYIYKDGSLLAALDLEFKDKISTSLPEGEYRIEVVSAEAGPLPSMTVGPVEIPAGANVALHAKLSGGKTPVIKVKIS